MRLLRHWKLLLSFLLVFAAGAFTGMVGTHSMVKGFLKKISWDGWAKHTYGMLDKRLVLTEEQKPKVRAAVDEARDHLKANFAEAIEQSKKDYVVMEKQIDAVLTAEQREVHTAIKRELREHFRKDLKIEIPME